MMVKVGIKSIPGINSSMKEKIPPKNPFLNPNIFQKTTAETGAQINSQRTGTTITALPITSITMHKGNEGKGFCLTG